MTTTKIIRSHEGITYESPDRVTWKLTSADTNNAFDYGVAVINHLSGPPLHIHHDQDELFHVLAGELCVQVNDERVDLGPGDIAFCPRGIPHAFANLKQEPVHVVGFTLGGGFDRFYADFSAALEKNPDPAHLAEVAATHNIELVGPPIPVMLGMIPMPAV